MITTVINMKTSTVDWYNNPDYQYIGRKMGMFDGYFGNPLYKMDGYTEWLVERLTKDKIFRERVKGLHGKILVCSCKPKPCHGDVLAMFADLLADGSIDIWLQP